MNLVDAIRPAIDAGAIIDRATAWPWVIELSYSLNGERTSTIRVLLSVVAEMPQPETLVPDGAVVERSVVFPATRFDGMGDAMREKHREHYAAFLAWRKIRARESVDLLALSETVQRWVQRGSI